MPLFITEYAGMFAGSPAAQVAPASFLTSSTVAIGGGSLASSAFGPSTRMVRLHADAACCIAFGSAPVAVATGPRLAAGQTEYFAVEPGQKVAAITVA